MKSIAWIVAASFALLFCGCQTSEKITRLNTPQSPLKRGSSIYVAVPEREGHDDQRAYEGSRFRTATACAMAFKQYGAVIQGRQPENLEKALASARAANCELLVKPEIRIWEDNPTEWNGERDVIEMDVETLDVSTGKSLSRVVLKGKSRWLTVGDKPERMLAGFFEPYASELFGAKK